MSEQGTMRYPPPPMKEEDEEEKPGDVYEGEMNHGKRHGTGKYTFGGNFVGGIYEGSYADGKKHGKGKLTFPDKSVYTGELQAAHGGMFSCRAGRLGHEVCVMCVLCATGP